MLDNQAAGFDAVDSDGKKVQIKTRRSENSDLPGNGSRLGRFAEHPFDYALLVLFSHEYAISEIWSAGYRKLLPIIGRTKRRNPSIGQLKKAGKLIYPERN